MTPKSPGGGTPVRGPGKGSDPTQGKGGGGAGPQDKRQQAMQRKMKLRMQIQRNLKDIDHKLVVMSGKGGVGKTTVAVNLAASLAKQGYDVGLLDLDLTNPNAPAMLDTGDGRPEPGEHEGGIRPVKVGDHLHVMSTEYFLGDKDDTVVWRGPIKMNVIRELLGKVEWGELDYLVIDLPPGTSDEPLTIAQLVKDAEGLVLVTTPQEVSLMDIRKSVRFAETVDMPVLGIVENMSGFTCPHCGEGTPIFGEGGGARVAEEFDLELLGQIPLEPRIVQGGSEGVPYVWEDPDTPTGKAFQQVVANVQRVVERRGDGD